jgi:hypothetical protein
MSVTLPSGLPIDSQNTALVRSSISAAKLEIVARSAKRT